MAAEGLTCTQRFRAHLAFANVRGCKRFLMIMFSSARLLGSSRKLETRCPRSLLRTLDEALRAATSKRHGGEMSARYNEIDAVAAHVMRELITAGVIASGIVIEKSIKELTADDVRGHEQVHLFAGGGLWSVAARLAGWPDHEPFWTASCPCQPFSQAGKGLGYDDPRDLWPDVVRLLDDCRRDGYTPPCIVGEQVGGKTGVHWFNRVRVDLEARGYEARMVEIPACAVDAPHIRNRIYWVAVDDSVRFGDGEPTGKIPAGRNLSQHANASFTLANADGGGRAGWPQDALGGTERRAIAEWPDDVEHAAGERRGEGRPEPIVRSGRPAVAGADAPGVTLGDAVHARLEGHAGDGDGTGRRALATGSIASADGGDRGSDVANADFAFGRIGDEQSAGKFALDEQDARNAVRPGSRNESYWSDAEWIVCHDGKARRTKPGLRLLVDGLPGRVDIWRIAGNAISPVLAAEVLAALREALGRVNSSERDE